MKKLIAILSLCLFLVGTSAAIATSAQPASLGVTPCFFFEDMMECY